MASPTIIDLSGRVHFDGLRPLQPVQGFVIHHTAGRGDANSVLETFRQRDFPAQFVIDRQGNIYQTLPTGSTGRQIVHNDQLGLSNDNTIGVEVIGRHDNDIRPVQVAAAKQLFQYLSSDPAAAGWNAEGLQASQVYGHGVVNPGDREHTEGLTIADAIQKSFPAAAAQQGIATRQEDISSADFPVASGGGPKGSPYGGPPGPWYDPKNHAAFQDLANQAADKYGIPRDVFNAMVYHESNWDPNLVSPAGAVGIAQVRPSTAGLTAAQLKDPATGLDAGAKYLVQQYEHFGSWPTALAAYNGGPGGTRAGAGYARDVMALVKQGDGAYAGASPVQQTAFSPGYPSETAGSFFGGGANDALLGSSRAQVPVTPQPAQVGGGQPLSPYVRGDFFPTPAPTLQPHSTPSAVYQPPTMAQLIQPYTTQYAAPAPSYAAMGAPPSPAAGAAAASGLQQSQLPVAPSDFANPFDVTQQNLPGQMPAAAPPPVADVAGSGGTGSLLGNIVQGVKHLVQTAVPGGLHMPQSFANAGMMSGITGFGGGPLPGGVTDRASGASWLGQQAWHPASLFNSSGGVNPGGGSSHNYFSPSSPGGIGGYVSHSGQLFTYPTDPDIYHSVAS